MTSQNSLILIVYAPALVGDDGRTRAVVHGIERVLPHDAELLAQARRTATGGWVVQLTEAPLDLDTLGHLEVLVRAYDRFPEIGGRGTP